MGYLVLYSIICKEIQVEEPAQKILNNNTKFICKLMFEKKVTQILNSLIMYNRIGSQVFIANPQKNPSKSSLIKLMKLYNALPLKIKILTPQKLKRKLIKWTVSFKE